MNGVLKGRSNRASYWLLLGVAIAAYAALMIFTSKKAPIGEVVLIFICVPRLHDIGWSGWWAGAIIAAEILVGIFAVVMLPIDLASIAVGGFILLVALLLVLLGLIPGQPFANAYGDPPAPGLSFGKTQGSDTVF